MSARALLVSVCLVAACAARAPGVSTLPPPPHGEPDALDLRFRVIAANLLADGLRASPLQERGFLPPGGRAAYPVRIASGQCALFVALGSTSLVDLDAALYTAEGEVLVEDDGASARPSLTLCASSEPLIGYLTLHAYQGAGAFVTAQFTRPAQSGDDLRTADHDALSALGQLAQTLHERGFEDVAPRVSLPLGDARPVRLAVNVDAGACYTLAAEAEQGLGALALRLVDPAGDELASGLGAEPSQALAALQYCASTRAELTLEVVAAGGQGTVRVGRFVASQAQLGGARALWLGEPVPSPQAWADAAKQADGVEAPRERAVEARGSAREPAVEARGSAREPAVDAGKPPFFSRALSLEQGQVIELPLVPTPAPCTLWQLGLEPGLWRATLRVESAQSTVLAEIDAAHMRACVVVCAAGGAQRVSLLGRAGFGRVRLTATAQAEPSGC